MAKEIAQSVASAVTRLASTLSPESAAMLPELSSADRAPAAAAEKETAAAAAPRGETRKRRKSLQHDEDALAAMQVRRTPISCLPPSFPHTN